MKCAARVSLEVDTASGGLLPSRADGVEAPQTICTRVLSCTPFQDMLMRESRQLGSETKHRRTG